MLQPTFSMKDMLGTRFFYRNLRRTQNSTLPPTGEQVRPSSGTAVYPHMPILRVAREHAIVARAIAAHARWAAMARATRWFVRGDSSDFGLLGEQSSSKWEISCHGRQRTAVLNLTPLALSSAMKSVTVQTKNTQTVTDISTLCLSACVDNNCAPMKHVIASNWTNNGSHVYLPLFIQLLAIAYFMGAAIPLLVAMHYSVLVVMAILWRIFFMWMEWYVTMFIIVSVRQWNLASPVSEMLGVRDGFLAQDNYSLSPRKRGNMFSSALVCSSVCVSVCDHDN